MSGIFMQGVFVMFLPVQGWFDASELLSPSGHFAAGQCSQILT